jgi:hypothetical protein
VVQPGELHQPVIRAVAGQKTAADLMALYEGELARAHAAHGIGFVPQPRETLAQAWLSIPDHLEEPDRDARHMNADYGLIAFDAIAGACPDLSAHHIPSPARPGATATALSNRCRLNGRRNGFFLRRKLRGGVQPGAINSRHAFIRASSRGKGLGAMFLILAIGQLPFLLILHGDGDDC